MNMEKRSDGEIRAINDEGTITAYLTKWDTVDAYNTTFRNGAFKKTFAERGKKIKFMFDHSILIGKTLEAVEDNYGPMVTCACNINTTAGNDAYQHLKNGDVDSFSFGFQTINDKPLESGVREITEVKMYECGPVLFPANEAAVITSVRSEEMSEISALIAENFERKSSFTIDELKILAGGGVLPLKSRWKLAELPEKIQVFHKRNVINKIESLCDELRAGGFSDSEKLRIRSLLSIEPAPREERINFENILKTLGG